MSKVTGEQYWKTLQGSGFQNWEIDIPDKNGMIGDRALQTLV